MIARPVGKRPGLTNVIVTFVWGQQLSSAWYAAVLLHLIKQINYLHSRLSNILNIALGIAPKLYGETHGHWKILLCTFGFLRFNRNVDHPCERSSISTSEGCHSLPGRRY